MTLNQERKHREARLLDSRTRLQIYVSADQAELVRQASEITAKQLSAFIREAMVKEARRIVSKQENS